MISTQQKYTSRERVLIALERKEPDRVPISFAGTLATGILQCPPDGETYTKLCKFLKIQDYKEADIAPFANFVGNVDERVKQKFGSDLQMVGGQDYIKARIEVDETKTLMGIFCGLRIKKIGYYDDVFEFPLRNCTSRRDIERYPYWPTPDDLNSFAEGARETAKNLRENTNYAIVGDIYTAFPWLMYALLTGYEKCFTDMKLNPKFYFTLADKLFDIGAKANEKFFGAVGDYIDIACTYDDLGTQQGSLVSHKDYVRFIKPYEKQMIEIICKHTSAKILRHSCGSVYEFIPDFIEIGVDILSPVQPLAKNMEPWRLKREFGKYLTFCGGIDTQRLLPHGTPEEVREEVKKTIEIYGRGGGYILAPSHNIEPDTPVENIVVMYEAAQVYGKYPIE